MENLGLYDDDEGEGEQFDKEDNQSSDMEDAEEKS